MTDGRINNGGAREGAGRKSKENEIKVIENMDAALAPQKVWENLAELVKDGNERAIRTWCAYRFGRPTEKIEMNSNQESLTGFKIIRSSND
jgi:hypothetical protein